MPLQQNCYISLQLLNEFFLNIEQTNPRLFLEHLRQSIQLGLFLFNIIGRTNLFFIETSTSVHTFLLG